MFTGIIETTGTVEEIIQDSSNVIFKIKSALTAEFHVDQSIAHNGVCLTITKIEDACYYVTAVDETLKKTNLKDLTKGSLVNLERSMSSGYRFDGHIVQGHVDQVGMCSQVQEADGSWLYDFEYDFDVDKNITVEKGSICINGVSLTLFNSEKGGFRVTIIPYTHEHTNFKTLKAGDKVNLEFDVIGKYIQKIVAMGYLDELKKQ